MEETVENFWSENGWGALIKLLWSKRQEDEERKKQKAE